MVQERNEPPSGAEGGKPKFLSGVNGVVAGLTGLAVALGGLVTAYKAITDDKPEARQAVAAEPAPPAEPAAAGTEQPPAARPALYKGDLYNEGDEVFDGGSMQLEHDGEHWILTADGEKYEYDELASRDKSRIVTYNAQYGSTLRWPVAGGEVEESTKTRRDAWKTYAKVDPAAAPAAN